MGLYQHNLESSLNAENFWKENFTAVYFHLTPVLTLKSTIHEFTLTSNTCVNLSLSAVCHRLNLPKTD